MSKNDGGPAFPASVTELNDGGIVWSQEYGLGGMSLRDWFAGQALAGMLAYGKATRGNGALNSGDCANHAYAFADAMLSQRTKGES